MLADAETISDFQECEKILNQLVEADLNEQQKRMFAGLKTKCDGVRPAMAKVIERVKSKKNLKSSDKPRENALESGPHPSGSFKS